MRTVEDLIKEFGEIPLCQCGCGNKVNINLKYLRRYKFNKSYPKFIVGHQHIGKASWNKGLTKETDERIKKYGKNVSISRKGLVPWNKKLTKEIDSRIKQYGEKISKSKKGSIPWNKGKKGLQTAWNKGLTIKTDSRIKNISQQTRDLWSKQRKGIPKSKIHKQKLSQARKEYYKLHPEDIENRKKLCGELNPNFGNTFNHTEDAKHKISIGNTGNIRSEELKLRDSEIKKAFYKLHPEKIMKGNKNPTYGKIPSPLSGTGIRTHYQSPLQGEICFRSSYELAYAKYLDSQKILWMYEIETFPLSDEMTYTPDFFLPQTQKFIEIKGWMKPKDQIKINMFLEQYPWDLEVLRKENLKNLKLIVK